jgi:SOS-response transcriptional repressor LexA
MSRQPVALTLKERFIGLRVRQRQVLEAVFRLSASMGYPPTIQQLCDVCELRSTSSMHYHLSILKQMGLLQWDTAKKRSVNLPQEVVGLLQDVSMGGSEAVRANFELPSNKRELTLPMLGTIAAGSPLYGTWRQCGKY